MAKGIPDDAFNPIEGDVTERVAALKKDNKRERQDYKSGQGYLFSPTLTLGNLPATISQLNVASEDSVEDVTAKQEMFEILIKGTDYLNARLLADTWCAAFLWKKDESDVGRLCPTEQTFRQIEDNPHSINVHVKAEVKRLSSKYRFFQWHLAFPDVFRMPVESGSSDEVVNVGGFDCVVGNPPWEKVKLLEKEWFANRVPEIAEAQNASLRRQLISLLKEDSPTIYEEFIESRRQAEGESHFVRDSHVYPLCGRGDINTYAIFTELNYRIMSAGGRVGIIVPAGIVSDKTTSVFFAHVIDASTLVAFLGFENEARIFPGVNNTTKFCILILEGSDRAMGRNEFSFAFFARHPSDLSDEGREFTLTVHDIKRLNPNTLTCPVFRSSRDALVSRHVYQRIPVLFEYGPPEKNPWSLESVRMFDMSNDSSRFMTETQLLEQDCREHAGNYVTGETMYVPLYESKMAHVLDHRFGTYLGQTQAQANKGFLPQLTSEQHLDPFERAKPQYWVRSSEIFDSVPKGWNRNWFLAYRAIARCVDERTFIPYVGPNAGYGNSSIVFCPVGSTPQLCCCLLANLSTLCFDYNARQKIGGSNVSRFIVEQLPVISADTYAANTIKCDPFQTLAFWLTARVLELTYTAWDLEAFALDCGYSGPPFRWNEERRFLLRCELDAAYFHLYLGSPSEWGTDIPQLREMFPTPRHAVDYITETFPIVRRKDIKRTAILNGSGEVTTPGSYITKDTILEIYDEMAEAIRTGKPYQTRLDPPPGPPTDAEGNFIPMAQWASNNWPSHIHPPREESEVRRG